jgi:hypothetical protein
MKSSKQGIGNGMSHWMAGRRQRAFKDLDDPGNQRVEDRLGAVDFDGPSQRRHGAATPSLQRPAGRLHHRISVIISAQQNLGRRR